MHGERSKLAHDELVYQDVECRPVDEAGATADDHFHTWWQELLTRLDRLPCMSARTHNVASLVEDFARHILSVVFFILGDWRGPPPLGEDVGGVILGRDMKMRS